MLNQSIFAILTGLLLDNQQSQTFELLHATLQQKNYTSSSFPLTL